MGNSEDNIRLGKLPDDGEVTSIISANGFKACFKTDDGIDYNPLVAWALLKDGTLLPVLYNKVTRSCVVAYAVTGFIEITHEDFLEDDEEEQPF